MLVSTLTDEKRFPFEKRAQQTGIPPMMHLDAGKPADAVEGIRLSAQLSRAAASRLFSGAPMALDAVLDDAEKSISHSFALASSISARTVSQFADVRSENVVGTLPGTKKEFVVVSA